MNHLLLCVGLLLSLTQGSYLDIFKPQANGTRCQLYVLQSGDTCSSIGRKNNATYAQLLSWNPSIDLLCSNLGNLTDDAVCISNPLGNYSLPKNTQGTPTIVTTAAPIPTPTPDGTNSYCGEYYFVAKGDDCSTLTTKYGIELKDFLFLNPEVSANCTNLLAEAYYCVRSVGYISTYPGYGGSPTTEPFEQMPSTPLPYIGDPWANFTTNETVIPLANGTRVDCYQYAWFDNLTENAAADCWNLAMVYGVTAEELILWNPSLAKDGGRDQTSTAPSPTFTTGDGYAYPCTVSANSSYCVALVSSTTAPQSTTAPPSPRAPGEVQNCTAWFAPKSFSTCEGILARFYLTIDEFYAMNPTVGESCQSMGLGTYYCVSTYPGGVPPPEPYNPEATTTTATTTPTTTTTSTGVVTPTPTQTGMVKNCKEFYLVQAGDGCWAIANDHGIVLDDFYAWNPAVKTDCTGLQANVYVCIGVSGSYARRDAVRK